MTEDARESKGWGVTSGSLPHEERQTDQFAVRCRFTPKHNHRSVASAFGALRRPGQTEQDIGRGVGNRPEGEANDNPTLHGKSTQSSGAHQRIGNRYDTHISLPPTIPQKLLTLVPGTALMNVVKRGMGSIFCLCGVECPTRQRFLQNLQLPTTQRVLGCCWTAHKPAATGECTTGLAQLV
ncbi:MAG: hypothetical protein AB7U75_04820 [Hyphomicrobiaceae bacterium]